MIKKETDSRREVTATDLEKVERAINDLEPFLRDLCVVRRILGEVGNLDQAVRGGREGIAAVQREGELVNAQLEAVKVEFAKVQQQLGEGRKELATLTAAVAEKERMLSAFSAQIDKITGKAA
jgi:septal ring factor EnvC (AmiA/AmiB activator)